MNKNKNCGAKAIFFVAMAALLVSMMLISAGNAVVGVSAGQWAKYGNVSISWNVPGATEPASLTEMRNWDWTKLTVQSVSGNTITVESTGQYKNGTPMATSTMSGDIETGSGNIAFFIIPANLGPGDTISLSGFAGIPFIPSSSSITETVTYGRTNRPTNRIRYNVPISELIPGASGSVDMNFYWDKATGILCELSISFSISYQGQSASFSMAMFLLETNAWSGTISPPGGGFGDIFGQWWFWVIIVVVIVGVVGGVVVMRMRAKKVPVAPPPPPPPPPV